MLSKPSVGTTKEIANLATISCGRLTTASHQSRKNPHQYPVLHRQMRRALVARFPYEILYEVENEEVIIYAIYHCARDPEVWKRRRDS
jgi:hypothetical protein